MVAASVSVAGILGIPIWRIRFLSATVIYRAAWGVIEPTPRRVQAAVKRCILSIILLDAAITGILCPWYYAVLVLALLLPTLVLGKWLYST